MRVFQDLVPMSMRDRVTKRMREEKHDMAAMPMHLIEVQSMGQDLAQKTVCVKVRLGRLGNTRKVSNSQVEVDTDKSLLLISKHLLDSKELRTITNFDGEIRRYLYDRSEERRVGKECR